MASLTVEYLSEWPALHLFLPHWPEQAAAYSLGRGPWTRQEATKPFKLTVSQAEAFSSYLGDKWFLSGLLPIRANVGITSSAEPVPDSRGTSHTQITLMLYGLCIQMCIPTLITSYHFHGWYSIPVRLLSFLDIPLVLPQRNRLLLLPPPSPSQCPTQQPEWSFWM